MPEKVSFFLSNQWPLLWTECLGPPLPQIDMLKSQLPMSLYLEIGPLWRLTKVKWGHKHEGLWSKRVNVLKRRDTSVCSMTLLFFLSPPYEDTVRRQLPVSQKKSSPESQLAISWCWMFQPPELWGMNFCSLWASQSMVLCQSRPGWPPCLSPVLPTPTTLKGFPFLPPFLSSFLLFLLSFLPFFHFVLSMFQEIVSI